MRLMKEMAAADMACAESRLDLVYPTGHCQGVLLDRLQHVSSLLLRCMCLKIEVSHSVFMFEC